MEEDSAVKDQSSASGSRSVTSRLLRYPLRSAARSKEEKPPVVDSSNSASAVKRGRTPSSVSKSVGVLDLSGKEKSAKPPRRLSIPSKPNASPAPKSLGNMTPISEARARNLGKSDTPGSDISRSSNRKKFSVLSSASYWLSQIKLSESAAKHSISLGFFKLALEAGCEPIQRMSYELKAYVQRNNIPELQELIEELFESYKISDNIEQLQVPSEGNQLFDNDDVRSSSSSITDAEKPKQQSLETETDETHQVKKATSKKAQRDDSVKKAKESATKTATSLKPGSEIKGRSTQKKLQNPRKQEMAPDKESSKKHGKKSTAHGEGTLESRPDEVLQENKENTAALQTEEITSAEV